MIRSRIMLPGKRPAASLIVSLIVALECCAQGIITTVAGTDIAYPGSSFSAMSASFGQLEGVAVSPIDGGVYFASASRSLIVKFNPTLNSVSIVAGIGIGGYSGDRGPARIAELNYPKQIAFDRVGNLYIADRQNYAVRKIDTAGTITTVAAIVLPEGVAVAPDNTLYILDYGRIHHVAADGTVSVVAGSGQPGYSGDGGPAAAALVCGSGSLAFDTTGNLFFDDPCNYRIRRIGTDGIISTIAGNGQFGTPVVGPATTSPLSYLSGLTADASGNVYFGHSGLVKVDSKGLLSILDPAQDSLFFLTQAGPLTNAIIAPEQLAFDQAQNLYFTDYDANCLYRSSPSGVIQAVAAYAPNFGIGDNGPGVSAGLNAPYGLGLMPDGSLLIADYLNQRIRRLAPSGVITTVAGNGSVSFNLTPGPALSSPIYKPLQAVSDAAGNIYVSTGGGQIAKISPAGILSILQINATGIATDLQGNLLAANSGGNTILRISPNGMQSVFAGSGKAGFSGDGGPAILASLSNPTAVAVDPTGNVYIADTDNSRVRKVSPNGIISTLAEGVSAYALACDRLGNVYAAEQYKKDVLEISVDGAVFTIAGNGTPGFAGDGGPSTAALVDQPDGIAVDGLGNVYISDSLNNRIREIPAAPPSIAVSSARVTISAPGFSAPTQTNINVSSSVQGLQYSIAFSTSGGGDWLGFNSLQGQAPGVLSIITDPSSLAPNTYHGTVTINSPYATPQTQNIQVTFEVTSQIPASMAVGSGPLNFALTVGNAATTSRLTISNQGGGKLSFSASATTSTGGSWLLVSPASGTASATVPASLTVTASPGSLPVGTYTGSITVSSSTTGQTITIPVTLAINPTPQTIVLSQTGLTFTAVAQGGSVIPQSIGILNTGSGSMTWTATVQTLTGSGWLSLSATSGTVTRPFLDVSFVDVSVNAQGLAAGQYFGSVQVTAPGASNSPQTAVVVLEVLPAGSNPGPQLRPTGLVFTAIAGASNPGSQIVTIANTINNPVVYGSGITYVNANGWVTYLPANASVAPDTPSQITVQPNFANLASGVYHAVLTLLFDDGMIRTVSILGVVAPPGTTPSVRPRSTLGAAAEKSTCTPTKLLPIVTQLGTGPSVSTGWPVAMVADVVDDCGFPMTSGSVVVSFTDGDPPLSMISLGNGQWSATWQPQNSNPAGVTVSLLAQESGLVGNIQTLIGFQGAQTLPVASGGVLNAVTLLPGPLAPGELVWIKGSGLADG